VNKPIAHQLELVPVAPDKPADAGSLRVKPHPCEDPPPIEVALRNAGIPVETVEKILAQAGPCDSFDWSADDSVIVKPRPGIAVYENKAGDIVIRTQNTDDPDDGDHFAFVQPEGVAAIIKALKDYLP
jgi:hypothetical protein